MLLERGQLRHHMHVHVASASASVVSERDHLAALMAELKQSVLVCNAQGIVLLYKEQAAEQLKNSTDDTRSRVPLGIGRSVRELFDAGLVDHALRTVDNQHARGVAGAGPSCACANSIQRVVSCRIPDDHTDVL